jgi:type IV pilus assembly protein PilB
MQYSSPARVYSFTSRTDEHQAAQDGKIVHKLEEEDLDIRVSIVPITNGEKVVMRILSEKSRHFSLIDLGFSEEELRKVEHAYKRPHGMILATGPTGSGKRGFWC